MDSTILHNNGMSRAWLDKNYKCRIELLPSNMECAIVQKKECQKL